MWSIIFVLFSGVHITIPVSTTEYSECVEEAQLIANYFNRNTDGSKIEELGCFRNA